MAAKWVLNSVLASVACLLVLLGADARPDKAPKPRLDAQGDPLPPDALARLGTARFRCPGGIKAIAFAPDGKTVYAHCGTAYAHLGSNIIRGFAVDSGMQTVEIAPLQVPGFTRSEQSRHQNLEHFYPSGERACLAADGTRVAFVTRQGRIRIVELPAGKEVGKLQVDPVVNYSTPATILPSGKTIAVAHLILGWSGGGGGRSYYDIASGKEIARIGSTSIRGEGTAVEIVATAPDETMAASTVRNKRGIFFWDLRTNKQTRQIDVKNMVASLAFSPDGKLLAYTEWQAAEVVLYDHATDKVIARLQHEGVKPANIWSVSFSKKGDRLVTVDEASRAVVWDVAARKRLHTVATGSLHRHDGTAPPVLSPDGKLLAFPDDNTLALVDVASGKRMSDGGASHRGGVLGMAISADGKTLYTHDRDTVRVWDVPSGKQRRVLEEPTMTMALSADGKHLATLGNKSNFTRIEGVDGFYVRGVVHEGPLKIWDTDDKPQSRVIALGRTCRQVAFAPDLSTIAVADWFNKVQLFDTLKGEKIHEWKENTRGSLVYSPDGKLLADNRIYISMALLKRGTDRPQVIGEKPRAQAVAFTAPDQPEKPKDEPEAKQADDPLPPGAKVRFGVTRYILRTSPSVGLVPPGYTTLLAPTLTGRVRLLWNLSKLPNEK